MLSCIAKYNAQGVNELSFFDVNILYSMYLSSIEKGELFKSLYFLNKQDWFENMEPILQLKLKKCVYFSKIGLCKPFKKSNIAVLDTAMVLFLSGEDAEVIDSILRIEKSNKYINNLLLNYSHKNNKLFNYYRKVCKLKN